MLVRGICLHTMPVRSQNLAQGEPLHAPWHMWMHEDPAACLMTLLLRLLPGLWASTLDTMPPCCCFHSSYEAGQWVDLRAGLLSRITHNVLESESFLCTCPYTALAAHSQAPVYET